MSDEDLSPETTETAEPEGDEAPAPATDETTEQAAPETDEAAKARADEEAKAKAKKDLPPSLRAAIRREEKARELHRQAEAKTAEAKRLSDAAQAREQQTRDQLRQWQEQVNPRLRELETIKRAASGGDYSALVEALGLDPRQLLDGLANEAANPLPDHVRRELAEARRFREAAKAREEEQARLQAEEQHQARLRAEDRHLVVTSIEVAGEAALPGLARYRAEYGDDALMHDAYRVRDQIKANTGRCTTSDLLREMDRRARVHYKLGGAAPSSATPAQATGPGKPGSPASPAATASGKRPGAIRSGMAAESAGVGREMTDAERRAAALAALKAGKRKS